MSEHIARPAGPIWAENPKQPHELQMEASNRMHIFKMTTCQNYLFFKLKLFVHDLSLIGEYFACHLKSKISKSKMWIKKMCLWCKCGHWRILISKACPSINARHLSRTDCPTNGVTGHKMAKCQGFINLNGSSIRGPSQIHIDQNVLEGDGSDHET